ncbi:MAG: hypothetical protein ABIL09_01710 [Gemmatimonadota bacterium]
MCEAAEAFEESLRLGGERPTAIDAGFRLGVIYYQMGDLRGASNVWQAVLHEDPSHSGAREGLRLLGADAP